MEAHQKIAKVISKVWEQKNFELLRQNLSEQVEWLEGSYSQPLTDADAVLGQWQSDLLTQSEIKAPVSVMGTNGAEGYYHCRASWLEAGKGKRELDGVFVVRLDGHGKINYFNSWWTTKPA